MTPQDASKDPRVGTFETLEVGDKVLPGTWTFDHWGFSEHGFSDANTGDFVPVTAVTRAVRINRNNG